MLSVCALSISLIYVLIAPLGFINAINAHRVLCVDNQK